MFRPITLTVCPYIVQYTPNKRGTDTFRSQSKGWVTDHGFNPHHPPDAKETEGTCLVFHQIPPTVLPIVQSNYSPSLRKTDTFFYLSQAIVLKEKKEAERLPKLKASAIVREAQKEKATVGRDAKNANAGGNTQATQKAEKLNVQATEFTPTKAHVPSPVGNDSRITQDKRSDVRDRNVRGDVGRDRNVRGGDGTGGRGGRGDGGGGGGGGRDTNGKRRREDDDGERNDAKRFRSDDPVGVAGRGGRTGGGGRGRGEAGRGGRGDGGRGDGGRGRGDERRDDVGGRGRGDTGGRGRGDGRDDRGDRNTGGGAAIPGEAAAGTTAGGTRRESESLDGSVSVSLGEAFCPWKYKIHTTARFEHYNLYCSSGNTGIVSILSTLLLVLVKLLLVSIPCFCSRRSD